MPLKPRPSTSSANRSFPNRRTLLASLAGVALLAGGTWALIHVKPATPGVAASESGLQLRWPSGTRYLYNLDWKADTLGSVVPSAGAPPSSFGFSTALRGQVALEGLGEEDGLMRVAVSYTRIDAFDFKAQGQSDASSDGAAAGKALTGQRAIALLDRHGVVKGISFDPKTPAGVQTALRALVQGLQVTFSEQPGDTWEATESTAAGDLRVAYQRLGEHRLSRHPVRLLSVPALGSGMPPGGQQLSGASDIETDGDGVVRALRDTANLQVEASNGTPWHASWTFILERTGSERFDARSIQSSFAAAEVQPLGAPVADPGFVARREHRLAEGMSIESIALEIDHFQHGLPHAHDFLVRAGAYLRLHPEADKALVEKFSTADVDFKGRGFILDVLVSAGDAAAQAAMRMALDSKVAHANEGERGVLLQRFAMVDAPKPESARYLSEVADGLKSGQEVRAAQGAAVALGAMVHNLGERGDTALANEINDRLRSELDSAATQDSRRALITALGNTGRADNVDALTSRAHDTSPEIRAQVASALRAVDSPEARQALISMAADPEAGVEAVAFRSLSHQRLAPADWRSLEQLVTAGHTSSTADSMLVALIGGRLGEAGDSGRAMLQTLLARNGGGENDLGTIIQQLLQGQAL